MSRKPLSAEQLDAAALEPDPGVLAQPAATGARVPVPSAQQVQLRGC